MVVVRILAVVLVAISSLEAGNWPQFRGPFFNGSTDEKNLPSTWSAEEVAWTAELPGPSAATPVVWEDHVFVSSADPKTDSLQALAFDLKTGKPLWNNSVAKGIAQDNKSNYASPSPATDGKLVAFFYGNGELAAFDFSGKKVWGRNIQTDYGQFAFGWTFSSSPLLYGGKLYLQVLQRDVPARGRGLKDRMNESYLLAMEPSTGKTLWRHLRPSKAKAESREAFTSPVPFETKGHKTLLVAGGDALSAHDPVDGKELWRWGTWNPGRVGHWRLVPSPVANDDVVLVCAPKREPVYAIKFGGEGELSDDYIAWTSKAREARPVSSDVPTPAYYDGDFFVLSDVRKTLSRVEPKTGKIKWTVSTPGRAKYEASPLAADGKLYLMNFDGDVAVVKADDGSVLGVVSTKATSEAPVRSSIVAAQGRLFIRTNRKLICVGKE
jgi:outer membrane protein assembly factor BamB